MSSIVAIYVELLYASKINVIFDVIGYNLVAFPSRTMFRLFFSSYYVWAN